VTVGAIAMCFVILPVAVVDVAIGVNQSTLTVGLVVGPVSLIHRAIGPDLDTAALANAQSLQPFAFVAGAVLEEDHITTLTIAEALLKLEIVIIEFAELLTHLLQVYKKVMSKMLQSK
jgi:hypothetical protein